MNFINPINNAEFQIGIVCALMCIMFIFLYVGVKLINRIEELRADMVQEDKATYDYIVKYTTKELKELTDNSKDKYKAIVLEVQKIKQILYRPLYEVDNTIWYNRGNDGKSGVHEDFKGVIVEVFLNLDGQPDYLVKSNEATINVYVSQSLITAWTN